MIGVFIRGRNIRDTHAKAMRGQGKKVVICKPRREFSEKIKPVDNFIGFLTSKTVRK